MNDHKTLLSDLKERENWVCWRYKQRDGKKTKIPVDPHTGEFASSSDSDTWSDFETAQEHYENSNTDGLGFVFGDNDLISGVDLDNIRDPETGELEDWAEDIIEQIDSYTEISPSGTGVHILQFGILPQNARTRAEQESTLERFDSSECEMYDSGRFFTMSFDHVEGTPEELKQRNDELREIHTEYLAEDDQEEDTTTTEPTESELDLSDQELIEKAKNAENGQDFKQLWNGQISAYDDDHSRADMALLQHLAFWTQKDAKRMEELFDQSGLTRPKWNSREDYRERSIQKAIRNCSDVYNPSQSDEDTTDGQTRTIPRSLNTPLVERNGCYCVLKENGDGEKETKVITTYTIRTNAVLVNPTTGSKQWDLTIHPSSNVEDSYDVVVEPSIFNELRKFKESIQIGETTTYNGGSSELNHIRQIVAHQDAPERTSTTKIGLHGGELVTPDGVFTDESEPEHRYVETGNAMDSKWTVDDIEDYDEESVQNIVELLPQTRDSERFVPILGWMYASAYTPYIRQWEGEIPMCGVDADTGAGKTSIIGFLTESMGLDGIPMSAQDTKFSLLKNLASTTSVPVWLDEYKPSDMSQYKLEQTQDLLRKVTRGGDETRGNADKTQEVYTLEAPVILSGEQAIQGAAEQRRMIRTQLKKSATQSGSKTAKAWAKLDGGSFETSNSVDYYTGYDPSEHASAYHQFVLNSDIDEFQETWNNCKEYIYTTLSDYNIGGINGIELTALTMIKWGMTVYRKFAHDMGADMDTLPENVEVESAIVYIANQMGESNRTSHVEEFLELVCDTARSGDLDRGTDYELVNQGKEDEQLLLKLRPTHQTVTEFINIKGLTGYDLLNNPPDYKKRLRDHEDGFIEDMSKYHRDLNRCIALDMEQLEEDIENFEANPFYNST